MVVSGHFHKLSFKLFVLTSQLMFTAKHSCSVRWRLWGTCSGEQHEGQNINFHLCIACKSLMAVDICTFKFIAYYICGSVIRFFIVHLVKCMCQDIIPNTVSFEILKGNTIVLGLCHNNRLPI